MQEPTIIDDEDIFIMDDIPKPRAQPPLPKFSLQKTKTTPEEEDDRPLGRSSTYINYVSKNLQDSSSGSENKNSKDDDDELIGKKPSNSSRQKSPL